MLGWGDIGGWGIVLEDRKRGLGKGFYEEGRECREVSIWNIKK